MAGCFYIYRHGHFVAGRITTRDKRGGHVAPTPFVAGRNTARDKRPRQKPPRAPHGFGATWPGHLSRVQARPRQKAPTEALFSTSGEYV